MKTVILQIIRAYQMTRFMRSPTCRFFPSCSQYCYDALQAHGLLAGLWLGLFRLLRCHPFHAGGIDEVPERFRWRFEEKVAIGGNKGLR